jgi:hypothetical protein
MPHFIQINDRRPESRQIPGYRTLAAADTARQPDNLHLKHNLPLTISQ